MIKYIGSASFWCLLYIIINVELGWLALGYGQSGACNFFWICAFVFLLILPACDTKRDA